MLTRVQTRLRQQLSRSAPHHLKPEASAFPRFGAHNRVQLQTETARSSRRCIRPLATSSRQTRQPSRNQPGPASVSKTAQPSRSRIPIPSNRWVSCAAASVDRLCDSDRVCAERLELARLDRCRAFCDRVPRRLPALYACLFASAGSVTACARAAMDNPVIAISSGV